MSIDRQWDTYLEQQGIVPRSDVIPDHACQVFDDGSESGELDAARELVHNLLQRPPG